MSEDGPTAEDINLANAIKTIELREALGLPIFERWLIERAVSTDVKPLFCDKRIKAGDKTPNYVSGADGKCICWQCKPQSARMVQKP